MNRTALKNYAPQARRSFIQAMTDRAAYYGLTANKIEPVVQNGDVAVIGGREHPRAIAGKRKQLEERIKRYGFEPTMEAIAYTWFNRLVAIRFMELHGYLEHGYRVLSHPEGKPTPEILEQAEHVALAGLTHDVVIDLKLAGNKEGELYRLLLTAQCNALHAAMPFLFERIDDETELLLPDNLLHSDSLIRKLVSEIEEQDWQQVEIIGWLYQFYISEKKDEVIGKVVASEDIPAATQLFTPNWIVKYLTQNTIGRQWLATYPQSALREQMDYYIEPAEQTPEVQEKLKEITPTSLNPEELTLLDPACGSGHILAEAYDLFKAIYQERGYRAKDIPALILQKNLFGLEIDDRAAQLASFALMMKARADDRRIFDSEAKPNILAFEDSRGMNSSDITQALNSPINKEDVPSEYVLEEIQDKDGLFSKKALSEKAHVSQVDIASLLDLFENAKTFGSLIQIPPKLAAKLSEIEKRLDDVLKRGDLTHAVAHVIKPLLHQARLLAGHYHAVVANPPYMGSKFYSPTLKAFVNREYKEAKGDLYSCFMRRNAATVNQNGFVGMITIPNWMFLASFEEMRTSLFNHQAIDTLIHNGRGVFGSDFGSCAFVFRNTHVQAYRGSFRRLFDKQGSVASNEELAQRFHVTQTFTPSNAEFAKIPGCPLAYWVGDRLREIFGQSVRLEEIAPAKTGLQTGDNGQFLRRWHEVAFPEIGFGMPSCQAAFESRRKWFSYAVGCMLGRYSLDKLGLIYAESGSAAFDPGLYVIFQADADGILPLLDSDWGVGDDASTRIVEFIGVAWPSQHLEGNLRFIADSLGPSSDEQPRETIRRYLATGFYKHHLSMYKRRPIYWLFSSGKQRAFQCLVYLNRYHDGTLARMRTEYVIPLQGQIAARVEQLEADKAKATSTSHRNKLQKEQTDLKKQQAELLIFEEKLKHLADQKITLDLDDGVKVNYAKFGDLLAESKAITGGKDDE